MRFALPWLTRRPAAACLLVLLTLSGCGLPPARDRPAAADPLARVATLMATMSVEEKVGQLMVVAFSGTSVTPDAAQMVRDYHVGGVILFQQNLLDAAQVRSLTGELQAQARVPLLIGVDQEGGPVIRVTRGVTIFPAEMAIGATFDPGAAGTVATETARELRALGINVNFSPVVDVNSNPQNPVIGVRSYGADPEQVSRFATAAVQGTQQAGVLAVAKHFPGHGDADVDSHRELPLIGRDVTQLQQVEWPPFQAAIAAGVDAVMTAHVLLPALEPDPQKPATLSPSVLGYLRDHLNYQGVIITDDLEMGAIVNDYGTADAAKMAFQAGADLLLFRRNVAEQQRAHRLLVDAVQRGEISRQRLDQSVRRILEAKARRGVIQPGASGGGQSSAPSRPGIASLAAAARGLVSRHGDAPVAGPQGTASPPAGEAAPTSGESVAQQIAQRSVTLVKNDHGLLPLKLAANAPVCVIYPRPEAVDGVEIGLPATGVAGPLSLGEAVKAVHPAADLAPVGLQPKAQEMQAALACARQAQIVIAGSYNLNEYPGLSRLFSSVLALGKPTVVVALRLPYDLGTLQGAPALLATYSNRPVSLRAAAGALFGQGPPPTGHLPVPVSARWPIGFGLLDWSRPDTTR